MFEDNIEPMNIMDSNPSSPETIKRSSFFKSKKGIAIIVSGAVIIITVIIVIIIVFVVNGKECEIGDKEKCSTCDENDKQLCGSCNEYYELIDGKCNEIKYSIRGIYKKVDSQRIKLINSNFIGNIESLRIDDKVLEKPVSEIV